MKLFKVKVLHGAPKDSHESIETYLIANTDEEVMYWIRENMCGGDWWDDDEHELDYSYYLDDDYEKRISFKEWILHNKGDIDDDNGWDDAYYGVTKWGWEEVPVIHEEDLEPLIDIGIATDITRKF